jgi:hypothetical protein
MTNEGKPLEGVAPLEEIKGNTYLVTEDLSKIIKTWCEEIKKPFPDPKGAFYDETMASLCNALQRYCFRESDVKVIDVPRASFADILERGRSYDADLRKEFWVSLDHVYADVGEKGKDGFEISITRFVDKDDAELPRGPRPESNFDTITGQVFACAQTWREASESGPRPVVLVDDGTFTGETITTILEELANHDMYVDSIRLGVANPKAINYIARWLHKTGHQVRFLGCLKLCPPVFDWVAERDFFPGVPLSGRVVGHFEKGVVRPYRAHSSGKPFRKPYLSGWGRLEDWAKITKGKDEFTIAALDLSIKLWLELERLWEQEICVNDLAAIPWQFYKSDPARMSSFLDKRWVDVLRDAQESLPG